MATIAPRFFGPPSPTSARASGPSCSARRRSTPNGACAGASSALDRASVALARELTTFPVTSATAVLQVVVDEARIVAEAEYAALGVRPNKPGQPFAPWVYSGMSPHMVEAIGAHPRPVGVLEAVFVERKPIRLHDLREHPAFAGFPLNHPPMHGFLAIPIRNGEDVFGNLYLANKVGGNSFTDEDERSIEMLGERVGLAIQIARLAADNVALFQAAQTAVNERDRFLAMASHELKTPLTPLLLQLELLSRAFERGTPTDAPRRLGIAVAQVTRLNRLVEELLDVVRIDAGRLVLTREDVDLGALAQEVAARFDAELARLGSALKLTVGDTPIRGKWDSLRIDQVITNLISNAGKYGGGKPIEVSVGRTGSRATLRVTDHGIGIPPEDQKRLFQRFERAVSDHHYGGFGLGLWIIRQIVDAHGGTVSLESKPGEGSTFQVELPIQEG